MRFLGLGLTAVLAVAGSAEAAPINVVNPSFEADPNNFNEYFLGTPNGWQLIDPGGITGMGDGVGTLTATGSPFYNVSVPDGDDVGFLFVGANVGTTEIGLGQLLVDTLAADTHYSLSVDVGNIQSATDQSGAFFDLRGFPGYRVELLAGGALLDQAVGLTDAPIPEGAFDTVTLDFITGGSPAQLGQALEIRLMNLNLTDASFPGASLEVDFDRVVLDATQIPEPTGLALLGLGLAGLSYTRRRGSARTDP